MCHICAGCHSPCLNPHYELSLHEQVKLPEDDITDYSTLEPTKVLGGTIIYGRYNDVQPFQRHDLRVHFAHNLPFVQVCGGSQYIGFIW